MEMIADPVRGGGCGSPAQMAMMEFPLFPVFLRAAVQTLHVPWGWAGLGKSACLPIIHLAALERKHVASCASMGRRVTKACLFSTSSLSFSCLLSLVFLCQEHMYAGSFTDGRPVKYHQDCLLYFSVRCSISWSSMSMWMTTHRRPIFCMLFMSSTTLVFVHLALVRSTFSKLVSSPSLYSTYWTGMRIKIYLWFSWHVQSSASQPRTSVIHMFLGLEVHWNSHLHTFLSCILNFWDFYHDIHLGPTVKTPEISGGRSVRM